jgi:homoserine dehydrogenase
MPSKLLTDGARYVTADKTDLAKLFAEVRRQAEKAGIPDMFTEQK